MFQFTLRDLFWATLTVSLGLAWLLHYQAVDTKRRAAIQSAERNRSVLMNAKRESDQLKKDVEFFKNATVAAGVIVHYHRKIQDVDWTVLEEPIPGGP